MSHRYRRVTHHNLSLEHHGSASLNMARICRLSGAEVLSQYQNINLFNNHRFGLESRDNFCAIKWIAKSSEIIQMFSVYKLYQLNQNKNA